MRTYYSYPAIESAYQTIEDESVALPQQTILDFQGAGVTVTDGGTKTIVTIPGGGGGGVPTTRQLTINGVTYDLSADRTWSVGTVTSVGFTAGTGISLAGTNPITGSGTITITNSAPDQTVVLTGGTGISTSGTYPNFTITNSDPASGVTLTSAGGTETLVNDGTGPAIATKGLTAGTGISLSSSATAVTITNSVSRTAGVSVDGQGGTISTGSKGYALIATGGTISRWYLSGKNGETGSITFDLKVGGVSIVGAGTKPFTTASQDNDAAPSGWTTTTLASGSRLEFNVDSATSCTWYNLTIVFI